MKHTPGPWHYTESGYIGSEHDGYVPIATPFREGFQAGRPQAVTNARLIAAAPEMLQALKGVKAHLDWVTNETRRKWSMRDQRVYELVEAALIEAEL